MARVEKIRIEDTVYELFVPIGQGGAGTVYLAKADNDHFAVKIIKLHQSDRKRDERFLNEVNYCSRQQSDHVVRILGQTILTCREADGDSSDYLCYAMPLYASTLRDSIRSDISIDVAFNLLKQLYAGVLHIHQDNVIHRDLKPENILLDQGKLVIADFGIAHFKNSAATAKNDLLANREYFAPEQSKQYDSRDVTTAADVFAVGLITNEMFTKEKPSGSQFKKIADFHPYLSDLDILVDRMTNQDPTQRVSMKSAKAELERVYVAFKDDLAEARDQLSIRAGTSTQEKVLEQAAEDILTANSLIKASPFVDWEEYNTNYHCNLHFRANEELRSFAVCARFLDACKHKLAYEGNLYKGLITAERPLEYDVRPSEESCARLDEKLESHQINLKFSEGEHLPGQIRKHFFSCNDYHSEELLRTFSKIEEDVESYLSDAPILCLAEYISLNILPSLNFIDSFRMLDFVEVIPELSVARQNNNDGIEIDRLKERPLDLENANDVLEQFERTWTGATYYTTDESAFIFFTCEDQYEVFRKDALEKAAGNYIFEGDVIDLLRPTFLGEDLVQLTASISFDVPFTLAKLLGLKPL